MYINKFKLRENMFIIFIFIVILEYQLSFVHTFLVDRIIKIVALSILIILFKNVRDNMANIYVQRITKIYLVLFSIMIISTIANLSVPAIGFLVRYSLHILFVLLLLHKVHPDYFSDRIIKFPIFLGAVFSINSIILWLLVYLGLTPDYIIITSERFTRIHEFSYLWGDMHYVFSGAFSRACSFFETPSRYGNFLIFPAFVSFGYFVLKKRYIYLFVCILCSLSIVLTFSLAVLLSYIGAVSLNIFFIMVYNVKQAKKSPFMAGIVGLLLGFLIIISVFNFYRSMYSMNPNMMFRGGQYPTIFYAFEQKPEDVVLNIDKPFGHGLAHWRNDRYYTAQHALVRWLLLLGSPGVIFFLVFFIYMFKTHVFPALVCKEHQIERYVALVFVAQSIADFNEGSWFSISFLYTTAILVLLKKYEFKEWKKFRRVPHLKREYFAQPAKKSHQEWG